MFIGNVVGTDITGPFFGKCQLKNSGIYALELYAPVGEAVVSSKPPCSEVDILADYRIVSFGAEGLVSGKTYDFYFD